MKRGVRSGLPVPGNTLVGLCLLSAGVLCSIPVEAAIVTVALAPAADTSIFEENVDASDAKGPGLFAGLNAGGASRRALLRFDVKGPVLSGSTISSVRLRLSLTRSNSGDVLVSLYRVTGAWGEGTSNAGEPGGSGIPATAGDATWTRRVYPAIPWTSPGGDTAQAASGSALVGSAPADILFDATPAMVADVQSWLDQPLANFGWQLRVDETQVARTAKRFGSRENAEPALRPVLLVTYDDAIGPPKDVPALDTRMLAALVVLLAACGARLLNRAI
jgi:hypothetical protein